MWTIGELLGWTQRRFEQAGVPTPRLDAEHLLSHALGCARMSLYVRHDEVVSSEDKATFRDFVRRRLDREPVAYIEGKRGFHALGLELKVDRRVLPPRPETEHLVDLLLEELPKGGTPQVLDIGTGSGAIALAVKRARPEARVIAADVSPDAIEVARSNADSLQLEVEFHVTDLLSGLDVPEGGWHAIAANLPYIPTPDFGQLEPEVAQQEPRLALDGGDDGLDLIRRLVSSLSNGRPLAPGGALYLEVGIGQAEEVAGLLEAAGFTGIATRADFSGIDRVVRAEN